MRGNGRPEVFVGRGGAMALERPQAGAAFGAQRGGFGGTADGRGVAKAAAEAIDDAAVDTLVVKLMSLDLLLTVLLQRVYVPISISLLSHTVIVGVLLMRGRVQISAMRVCLYWLFWGAAVAVQFTSGNTYSATSLELGIVSYLTFLGVVPASRQTYMAFLRNFQKVALGVAGLIFMDIVCQLAGLGMPSMNAILPASMSPATMNYIQATAWKSSLLKPNGFFMLEASYASQFVALGLVFEISFFRRWRWLVAYALALLMTFSGTGLMLLLLCLPILCWRMWRRILMFGLVLVPVLGGIAVATGWWEIAARRAATFDDKNSSANERFVSPFQTMYEIAASGDVHRILFGFGAGKTAAEYIIPGLKTDEFNAVSKVFIEYGFFVLVLFFIFMSYVTFTTGAFFLCAYVTFMEYNLMGGYFLLPPIVNYLYLLAAGWAIRPDPEPGRGTHAAPSHPL